MRVRALLLVLSAATSLWCSPGGDPLSLGRDEPAGGAGGQGAAGGSGGLGGQVGIDARQSDAFGVDIVDENRVVVEFMTLSCAGACAVVEAVARGGFPPYTYRWEDGGTNAVRHVCPSTTTEYLVVATDTGFSSPEFQREPQTTRAELTARVLDCSDAGTTDAGVSDAGPDGGVCSVASTFDYGRFGDSCLPAIYDEWLRGPFEAGKEYGLEIVGGYSSGFDPPKLVEFWGASSDCSMTELLGEISYQRPFPGTQPAPSFRVCIRPTQRHEYLIWHWAAGVPSSWNTEYRLCAACF